MIQTVDGYKCISGADVDGAHPHGDLDRIAITGDSSSMRGGAIRGEPVAWIRECLSARADSLYGYTVNGDLRTFTRMLDGTRMNLTTAAFNNMNGYPFVYSAFESTFRGTCYAKIRSHDLFEISNRFSTTYWGSRNVDVITRGSPVKAGPIDYMTAYMDWFKCGVHAVISVGMRGGQIVHGGAFSGITLSGDKYEFGYDVQKQPSDFAGYATVWKAFGSGEVDGGSWIYSMYDYRVTSGSKIRISATEDQTRYVEHVIPLFFVRYNDYLSYSDTGDVGRYSYDALIIGDKTYTFDSKCTVEIDANDINRLMRPTENAVYSTPGRVRADGVSYTTGHSVDIDHILLVATMKSDVVDP